MVTESKRDKAAFLALPAGDKAFEMQETLDEIERYVERVMTNSKGDQILTELKGIHKTLHSIDLGLNVVAQVITDRFPVAPEAPVQPDKPMVVNQFVPGEVKVESLIHCSSCGEDLPEYEFSPSYVSRYKEGSRKSIRCRACDKKAAKQRRMAKYWPLMLNAIYGHQIKRGTPEDQIREDQRFTVGSFGAVFNGSDRLYSLSPSSILKLLIELTSEGYLTSIKGRSGNQFYICYEDVDLKKIIGELIGD